MNRTKPVLRGPVAVRQYLGWYATGFGCGCPIWKQKTGLNRTLKHYVYTCAKTHLTNTHLRVHQQSLYSSRCTLPQYIAHPAKLLEINNLHHDTSTHESL